MTHASAAGGDNAPDPTGVDAGAATENSLHAVPPEPTRADVIAQLAELQGRAETMPAIEQAKGALMLTYGLSAEDAFDLLRQHSKNRNVKIRDIALRLTKELGVVDPGTLAVIRMDSLLDDITMNHRTDPAAS